MGSQDESSLAARRARLRGSLTKQALPADPYSQDQYARAKTPEQEKAEPSGHQPTSVQNAAVSVAGGATKVSPSNGSNGGNGVRSEQVSNNGAGQGTGNGGGVPAPSRPGFRLEDLAATQQLKPAIAPPDSDFAALQNAAKASSQPHSQPSSLSSHMPTSGGASSSGLSNLGSFGLGSLSDSLKSLSRNPNSNSGSADSSSVTDIADWSTAEPEVDKEELNLEAAEAIAEIQNEANFAGEFASIETSSQSSSGFFDASEETTNFIDNGQNIDGSQPDTDSSSSTIDDDFLKKQQMQKAAAAEEFESAIQEIMAQEMAAERIAAEIAAATATPVVGKESRAKKASGKATKNQQPTEEAFVEPDEEIATSPSAAQITAAAPPAVSAASSAPPSKISQLGQMHVIVDEVAAPTKVIVDQPAHVIIDKISHIQVLDTLTNMDQAMSACAMNLSALQASANLQTEALRGLAEVLQNQTFSELGMGLSGLMESLSAALEPMKAVSELVPAIDQLVQVMETKIKAEPEKEPKLSPDQLVMNLADHLSTGAIDPWTFKSAYMAVFPDDHPADLLHRLVDLLGTSKLSGNLFRAAYDAVQAPDPPKRSTSSSEDGNTIVKVVQDESLMQQLDELRQNQNEFEKKMGVREEEFSGMLQSKEQELQDAQELLNSRWEEFNQRYDELSESLQKRDVMIQEKETEIARKDNENGRLRNQMDELKDMVSELQKQFSASKARAEALSKPGFFDSAPAAGQAPSLFDAAPAKPLFQGDPQQQQQQHQLQQPQQQQPQQVQQSSQSHQPAPQQQQPPAPMPQQHQQPAAAMQAPPQPAMSSQHQEMNGSGMGAAPPQMAAQPPSQQAIPRQSQMTTPFAGAGPGSYGSGVRAQVFEVIVRQALAGAPWREICAGPMQVNNISPDEVESEVKRRQALLKK